jgi:hypothetical protein
MHVSDYHQIILHPAYQGIIGLGMQAVPLILQELRDMPASWFWALRAITGADPTTPHQAGNNQEMANAWLQWGEKQGYL